MCTSACIYRRRLYTQGESVSCAPCVYSILCIERPVHTASLCGREICVHTIRTKAYIVQQGILPHFEQILVHLVPVNETGEHILKWKHVHVCVCFCAVIIGHNGWGHGHTFLSLTLMVMALGITMAVLHCTIAVISGHLKHTCHLKIIIINPEYYKCFRSRLVSDSHLPSFPTQVYWNRSRNT